jgi:hypothetical protein
LMAEILDDLSDASTNICSCYLTVSVGFRVLRGEA